MCLRTESGLSSLDDTELVFFFFLFAVPESGLSGSDINSFSWWLYHCIELRSVPDGLKHSYHQSCGPFLWTPAH